MKTAIFSLFIACTVLLLSLFQFEKYQKFALNTQLSQKKLEDEVNLKLETAQQMMNKQTQITQRIFTESDGPLWKMAEIDYLVSAANARLLSREVNTAIRLLTIAQEKIEALNDARLTPLYQAVTKDRDALQTLSMPNLTALWRNVSTLMEEASQLAPRGTLIINTESKTAAPSQAADSSWQQKFSETLSEMKDLIKIRHYSKPVEPLLSESEKRLIQLNLQTLFETTRLAILSEEPTIYLQSIQDLKQWLAAYYDDTQSNVKHIDTALTELNAITLRPEIPKLSSIDLLTLLR